MSSSGAAARDGRLKVGMRILEVNHQSLLGMTHTEAVQILRGVGDALLVLVCDGFDPKAAAAIEVSGDCPTLQSLTCDVGWRGSALQKSSGSSDCLSPVLPELSHNSTALKKISFQAHFH